MMFFFISIEAQNATENGMSDLLAEFSRKIIQSDIQSNSEKGKYGFEFNDIAIIPTNVDDGMWNALGWKERILIRRKSKEADIRLRMDYDRFMRSDTYTKREMFIDIIVRSIRAIQDRSKADFNGEALISDFLRAIEA